MDKRTKEYEQTYQAWVKGLSASDRAKLAESGLDKPLLPEEHSHSGQASGEGMSFTKAGRPEPSAYKLATICESHKELEIVCFKTPLDDVLELEKEQIEMRQSEEAKIAQQAISGALSYLFSPKNEKQPTPFDVLCRLFVMTNLLRPSLVEHWDTLEKLATAFDVTKQAISKQRLKMEKDFGLRSRTGKSAAAVSVYAETTQAYWDAKKAAEKRQKRLEYLKDYARRNREKKKAEAARYYEENRSRLLSAAKERRKGKK